jgi:dihydrofolate reductase
MITFYGAISLDGRIAGAGDDLAWLETAGQGGVDGDYGYRAFYATTDVTVIGRRTWSVCKSFDPWPYGEKECVVITSQEGLVPVANETFAIFEPEFWRKRSEREHVYLVGGGELLKLFLDADLVDRVELAIIPRLLGRGPLAFPDGASRSRYRLAKAEAHQPTGVVQLAYERA